MHPAPSGGASEGRRADRSEMSAAHALQLRHALAVHPPPGADGSTTLELAVAPNRFESVRDRDVGRPLDDAELHGSVDGGSDDIRHHLLVCDGVDGGVLEDPPGTGPERLAVDHHRHRRGRVGHHGRRFGEHGEQRLPRGVLDQPRIGDARVHLRHERVRHDHRRRLADGRPEYLRPDVGLRRPVPGVAARLHPSALRRRDRGSRPRRRDDARPRDGPPPRVRLRQRRPRRDLLPHPVSLPGRRHQHGGREGPAGRPRLRLHEPLVLRQDRRSRDVLHDVEARVARHRLRGRPRVRTRGGRRRRRIE
mmetsp:Transcript_20228/g.47539  ORF Transcript_20228/g.47539 Transcript_20228/m.47539 type:complete len:307 (-) Transcript_20228:1031-1951(-)